MATKNTRLNGLEVAIIGMSCSFPESSDYREYWNNLKQGKNLIKTFSDGELRNQGVSDEAISNPLYVKSSAVLSEKDVFDQGFFGYTVDEASLMDPQIRLFHQTVWSAIEDSGYASKVDTAKMGLFAGASSNDHWKIYAHQKSRYSTVDPFYSELIAKRSFISTLVSYKLNLRGPAVFIDTACSSSLVAVHQACISLLTRECTIAIAGGVSIKTQREKGYYYKEGMVRSTDGQCRAFDANASGTAVGEGAGVVVLKRLNEAIADQDHIYAIIKGSAVNNDGSNKVGFTAPSVKGQKDCIKRAHKVGDIDPKTIGYVETHGTATKLGDPIEVRALNEAFNITNNPGSCAIGSTKTNMGHLDAAAGIAGLIKATLSIKNRKIPASLNYQKANPEIDFSKGPFYVNTALKDWSDDKEQILRAGVSSFGIGGTNAHVVLEQALERDSEILNDVPGIITLSAKTVHSLQRQMEQLLNFLSEEESININSMSYTLQVGRKHFKYRKSWVCHNKEDLQNQLKLSLGSARTNASKGKTTSVAFMFPGQGSQYSNMGKELYQNILSFKQDMDAGFTILKKQTDIDFRAIIYPPDEKTDFINDTQYTQPLVFLLEYCLAKYLISLGISPKYTIGHSLGEYVSACLDGVFSLEDALKLVVKRGELMNSLPAGAMVSVALSYSEAVTYCNENIAVAAVNGPEQTVLSGSLDAINDLEEKLEGLNIPCVRLRTSHAFHSSMQDAILDDYRKVLKKVSFNSVSPTFISCVSGELITKEEVVSVEYWVKHLRDTVHFAKGMDTLAKKDDHLVLIEVGCGRALSNLWAQISGKQDTHKTFNLMGSANETRDDMGFLAQSLGKLWEKGIDIKWEVYHKEESIAKMSLPTYAFERNTYLSEIPTLNAMSFSGKNGIENEMFTLYDNQNQEGTKEKKLEYDANKLVERPDLSTAYVAPDTEMEKKLTTIIEAFFSIQKIGIEDNFFELGGDSLKAMSLIKKIKIELDVNLSLKHFFNASNIRELAVEVEKNRLIGKQIRENIQVAKDDNPMDMDNSEHFSI